MARVRLTADQELPPVCARCGRPAVDSVDRTFAWHPPWVGVFIFLGVLPGLLLMFYLTRRQTVHLPMCGRHRRHWKTPAAVTLFGLPLCVAVILLGVLTGGEQPVVLAGVYLFFGLLIVVGIWHGRVIRPVHIGRDGIVLTGVCEEFADEAETLRDGRESAPDYGEYDDDDARPRRRNRYDIDVEE